MQARGLEAHHCRVGGVEGRTVGEVRCRHVAKVEFGGEPLIAGTAHDADAVHTAPAALSASISAAL